MEHADDNLRVEEGGERFISWLKSSKLEIVLILRKTFTAAIS